MRIVGIDWGTSRVKAVEIDSAFGRYEIHDYREIEVDPGTEPVAAAAQLIGSLSQKPHRIVVAMRASQITTRNLHLPTRDRKAIQAGVLFQLEDELPFSIDDMVLDSSTLSQTGQQSDVHVATTLKKHLAAEIQKWGEIDVEPDVITTEGWAFRTLINRTISPTIQEKPLLLVYVGAKTTLLYLHWRGFPMVCREIRWGGDSLTRLLVTRLGLSEEQAERVKRNPAVLSETHPQSLIQLVSDGLEDIQREIKHMDLVCKGMAQQNLNAIYITGGGSLIDGLPAEMEARIGIPVERIRPLSALSPSGVTFAETSDAKMGLAAALTMSLVGSDRNLVVNLRRGEFSKITKGREFNVQSLKKPIAAVGLVAASFFVSMAVQSSILQQRLEDKDAQLKRTMSGFFGSVSNSAMRTYLASPASLRTAIQKELDKTRESARVLGTNTQSPVVFLKNLSSSISKDTVVDMMDFQIGAAPQPASAADKSDQGERTINAPVELVFLSTDSAAAERLAGQLAPKLIQAPKTSVEDVPASGKEPKKFKITFRGTAADGGFQNE
jgi:general secretion pathway protein L